MELCNQEIKPEGVDLDQLKILVVENDPMQAEIIQYILLRRGWQTVCASNAQEALMYLDQFEPDCILCDLMMQGMDGLELYESLKKESDYGNIPIIFLSACQETFVIQKAFSLGAKDFIAKPFKSSDLVSAVSRSLSPYRYC